MKKEYEKLIFKKSYVNGGWHKANSEETFEIINPSTQDVVAKIEDGGVPMVDLAIKAAEQAFPKWSKTLAKDRSTILERWWSLILENQQGLAELMTAESGKPLKESLGEVKYAASFIKWFAEEGRRANGSVVPTFASDKRVVTLKQPIGVVGAMTPWNFPLAMITRKIAPALAAGCTVVVRPSNLTPLSALALAHLADLAEVPAGVLNFCVSKDSEATGKTLCASEVIRKISFTGSTRVGAILMKQSAPTIKKLSLELGGNAPFIVFEDADIDKAVEGAIASKFRNAGQTCVCVNRFLVHEKVYKQFTDKFVKKVEELKTGDGFDPSTDVGPLISEKAVESMQSLIEDATSKGGKILSGGKKIKGQFFQPTVIGDATSQMKFAQDEIFGPIAPIFKFSTEDEAIKMANDTIFGLASYIYTQDVSKCWRVSEALEYGMVGINEGLISTEVAPFGGVKSSGLGREGSHYGIDDYLEIKYLCFGNID